MIRESLRFRLTVWYTAFLAIVLVGFAVASYLILARAVRESHDASLAESANLFREAVTTASRLKQSPEDALRDAAEGFRHRERRIDVYDSESNLVVTSADELRNVADVPPQPPPLIVSKLASMVQSGRDTWLTLTDPTGERTPMRIYASSFAVRDQPFVVLVSDSMAGERDLFRRVRYGAGLVIVIVVIIASVTGGLIAYRGLRSLADVAEQASKMDADTLDSRIHSGARRDEVGRLTNALNDLLNRLEKSFSQQRRLMADASHELRTPLTILRGEAELALSRTDRSIEEYRDALSMIEGEARRLSRIVEDLFTMARAEAGQYQLIPQPIALEELAGDSVRSLRSVASTRGIALSCETVEEHRVMGDPDLLHRLVINLLDNALKFTPAGGQVTVDLSRLQGRIALTVRDTGPGIPEESRSQIFEPFFRGDPSRSRDASAGGEGAGLGLSIALWIARVHGGSLEITSTGPEGTVVTLTLPAA